MSSLNKLFERLNFNHNNGLYTIDDIIYKQHPFPFRISHILSYVLKPDAVLSPHQSLDDSFNPINNPLILFYENPSIEKKKELAYQCFSFSQAAIVFIIDEYGNPEIFHGYDFEGDSRTQLKKIEADIDLFRADKIASGRTWEVLYDKYYKNVKKVDKWLLSNVIDARRLLISIDYGNLPHSIANSLIGRLLFIRYLIDRDVQFSNQSFIVGNNKVERAESLNNLLLNKKRTYEFFRYLTSKFQGDLFPIQDSFHSTSEENIVEISHLEVLHHLFSCSKMFVGNTNINGYQVQLSLFNIYDFQVIPVELISNIYENFLGNTNNSENQKRNLKSFQAGSRQSEIKAYYTPPFMVDYVLSQTLDKRLRNDNNFVDPIKVLDPACGSGIFLVETIRKLVQKHLYQNNSKEFTDITNDQLWKIVRDSIFGIDIDNEAVEITVFSIYITLLDYKTPVEIENFKFLKLKGINLFSGSNNDFFNRDSEFEKKLEGKKLDFIIGNPPWGQVKESSYLQYIKTSELEKIVNIGNNEISQAFLMRVKDFMTYNTECMLIVTSKTLYNTEKSKTWRQWFLKFYELFQITELSPVNNKVTGGPEIFEGAKQSAAILHFKKIKTSKVFDYKNLVKHIVFRPNLNFLYFKAITVSRRDIKYIPQYKFIEDLNGSDWLWKILVHGSNFDYEFIKRLKSSYNTLFDIIEKNEFEYKGGLKYKDGQNSIDSSNISDMPFLELENRKELKQFTINASKTINKQLDLLISKGKKLDYSLGYLPNLKFFKGHKLIFKKGLEVKNDFKGVAAISKTDLAFSSSVMSIIPSSGNKSEKQESILWNIAGLINSSLFSYFMFNTSSSAGIDRTRIYFNEFLNFPIALDQKIAKQAKTIQEYIEKEKNLHSNFEYIELLNEKFETLNELVFSAYKINPVEKSLIDYSINVAIPNFKRLKDPVYLSPSLKFNKLEAQLTKYSKVFSGHFTKLQGLSLDTTISIGENFSISLFKVTKEKKSNFELVEDQDHFLNGIQELTISNISKGIYLESDLRGFGRDFFYIIKPSEIRPWHETVAHEDLAEIISVINQS